MTTCTLPFIPLYAPYLKGNEKKYVNECLDSTWISSKGEFIKRFEDRFCEYTKIPAACSVTNGTVAIHVALTALDIGPGDEVLVPSLTYVASVNPILQVGAKPVFVDIDPITLQIDTVDLRRKITPRTKCVIVVHLYGAAAPMPEIQTICETHNLLVVEDCAEALGTHIDAMHVGSFSDIATFSFFGNKTVTTGEGGMVASRRADLLEKVRQLKQQAVDPNREYWHVSLGFNYRMTNICAAIGLAQMENLGGILSLKRDIAHHYMRGLDGLPLRMQPEACNTQHSFWLIPLIVDSASDRDPLREHLKKRNIETRPFFHPAHKLPHLETDDVLPHTEAISAQGLCVPSFPGLDKPSLERIVKAVADYFDRSKS